MESEYALTPLAKADVFHIWAYIAAASEAAADRVEQAMMNIKLVQARPVSVCFSTAELPQGHCVLQVRAARRSAMLLLLDQRGRRPPSPMAFEFF
jgi:hypothetical protein